MDDRSLGVTVALVASISAFLCLPYDHLRISFAEGALEAQGSGSVIEEGRVSGDLARRGVEREWDLPAMPCFALVPT